MEVPNLTDMDKGNKFTSPSKKKKVRKKKKKKKKNLHEREIE